MKYLYVLSQNMQMEKRTLSALRRLTKKVSVCDCDIQGEDCAYMDNSLILNGKPDCNSDAIYRKTNNL